MVNVPWPVPVPPEGCFDVWVEGVKRRVRAISLHGVMPGTLPYWQVDVDGFLGEGGTWDAAVVLAARRAALTAGGPKQ